MRTDGCVPPAVVPDVQLDGCVTMTTFDAGAVFTVTEALLGEIAPPPVPVKAAVTVFDCDTVDEKLPVATPLASVVNAGCVTVLPLPVTPIVTVRPLTRLSN